MNEELSWSLVGEPEAKSASKNLPGGGTQFYLPNFKVGHISSHSFKPL